MPNIKNSLDHLTTSEIIKAF